VPLKRPVSQNIVPTASVSSNMVTKLTIVVIAMAVRSSSRGVAGEIVDIANHNWS
jgi:hypothetical protein